jgi:hypothetical protein
MVAIFLWKVAVDFWMGAIGLGMPGLTQCAIVEKVSIEEQKIVVILPR